MPPGTVYRLDLEGDDDDEDDTTSQKSCELGVISVATEVSWFVCDVVGKELELQIASNSQQVIAAFLPGVMRW